MILFLVLSLLLVPELASAQSPSGEVVAAQIIAENTTVRPGTPFLAAVHLRVDPGWHIYWKNPGDTGLPTTVSWDLPKGFAATTLLYPVPKRFVDQGLVSYGYEGEVTLVSRIVPPSPIPSGNVTIRAHVSWLACKIECTPGKADLAASLPVGSGAPIPDRRWTGILNAAMSQVPSHAPGVSASLQSTNGRLRLQVTGLSLAPGSTAYFVPLDQGILAEGARTNAIGGSASTTILLQPAKGIDARELHGVLVVEDQTGTHGVLVDATRDTSATANGTGFLLALVLAFVGGLILNLMPCVLPVVSLKILSFVRHGHDSGASAVRHGLLFGAGVLVSFWVIAGLLEALRAGGQLVGWGFQFQSPAVVVVTAALFFLIALNLLDVFEVRLPVSLPRASGAGQGTSSFLSGLLATAVATPCTAPFMGGALGYALTQPPGVGFGVFTALALGLAGPYVLLSALPGLVSRIPKPGSWMVTLRQVLAFPMLGAVIWMMYVLVTLAGFPALMTLLSAILVVGFGAWIYGRWGGLDRSVPSRLISASLAVVLIVGATTFSAVTSAGAPPPVATNVSAAGSSWERWSPERIARLREAGGPVFVDFTAKWCLTCQVNEQVALHNPAVEQAFRQAGVTTLKADWTDRSDDITRTLASFGRAGVPVYALYPRGATSPILLPELLTPGIVLEALQKLH